MAVQYLQIITFAFLLFCKAYVQTHITTGLYNTNKLVTLLALSSSRVCELSVSCSWLSSGIKAAKGQQSMNVANLHSALHCSL